MSLFGRGMPVRPRAHVQENYLGSWPWGPDGFVSEADETAMWWAMQNLRKPVARYADDAVVAHLDHGDEVFGGNSNAWIPYLIAGRDTIESNHHHNVDPHYPYQQPGPSMRDFATALYDQAARLWQDIRDQTGSSWE